MALPASLLSTYANDTSMNAKMLIFRNRRRNILGVKNHGVSKTETLLLVKDDFCIFSILSDLLPTFVATPQFIRQLYRPIMRPRPGPPKTPRRLLRF